MFLSPSQIVGEAEHLARKPTIARATRQVGAFNNTGMHRLTAQRRSQARLHYRFRAEDEPRGAFHYTPPFPALNDLGIVQVRRREELGCGLGTTVARSMQADLRKAVHVQHGVSLVRQLITGKEWYRAATDSVHTLEQHVGVLLIAFAHHQGSHQAPCWRKGAPHPRIAIEC